VPLHTRMRVIDRDLIRGGHYGQRSCEPRKQAEHMAATDPGCYVKILLANSEPMVWTPPPGRVEFRTWTAAREDHHAGRSNWLGLGKVRV
jgi:hypothetical protein